ncbi:MAG TPA: peptidylprolyl isomerase [Vicinamibacterales bacterium]|nr:peptidylprolyl isomerase [Vicinamibacterales bacterium]
MTGKERSAATAAIARRIFLCGLCLLSGSILSSPIAYAQDDPPAAPRTTRLAVLQAEDRRAPTPRDLAIIRSGLHGGDAQTVRVAVRALGRLERPALIADLVPSLRHALPEIRSEAANAIAQAAQGWKGEGSGGRGQGSGLTAPTAAAIDGASNPLAGRLKVEAEPDVREALCDALGRLPYVNAAQAESAERTLLEMAGRAGTLTDRLGVAQGLEGLVRTERKLRAPDDAALTLLRRLVVPLKGEAVTGARVRRLALEALTNAAAVDVDTLGAAAHDPDAQVRRLAVRAAAAAAPQVSPAELHSLLTAGRADDSPIVRLEALRSLRTRNDADACAAALAATGDRDPHVALFALDQLGACGSAPDATAALDRIVTDLTSAGAARGWHRAAHALVALASAQPSRGAAALPQFTGSRIWQLRLYAARAAAELKARDALEQLARDQDDNVAEAAVDGLRKLAGHDADAIYLAELSRRGHQVLRAAALALDGTPHPEQATPALQAAWQRLIAEGHDNSHDARDAIAKALTVLGDPPKKFSSRPPQNDLNAEDLHRLAAPRARVAIRGVGTFELALFTSQAPAAVLRFAHLAEAGYYNGLTFHRVVANFVIQGGSPGASEYVGDASFMRDEVGLWPHVRGAVGISTRGRDTGDAQIFVDLVDNPRLDHEYTVFAQVLNGIEVVDQVLEGDIIDRIDIVVGP